MRKVLLNQWWGAGDVVALTGAVRDLCLTHPDLDVAINCHHPDLWLNNPYVTSERMNWMTPGVEIHTNTYSFNPDDPQHIVEYFRRDLEKKLNLQIIRTVNTGHLVLTQEELDRPRQIKQPYWVIMAGGKNDIATKWYPFWQQVVDGLQGKIHFVQCGAREHVHQPLQGVTDRIGQTPWRDMLLLLHHADGLLSGITGPMHALAALPVARHGEACALPSNGRKKAGVVVCGGREDLRLIQYGHNTYLDTLGQLDCCLKPCWKDRTDGKGMAEHRCLKPIQIGQTSYAGCMKQITPEQVIKAVLEKQGEQE